MQTLQEALYANSLEHKLEMQIKAALNGEQMNEAKYKDAFNTKPFKLELLPYQDYQEDKLNTYLANFGMTIHKLKELRYIDMAESTFDKLWRYCVIDYTDVHSIELTVPHTYDNYQLESFAYLDKSKMNYQLGLFFRIENKVRVLVLLPTMTFADLAWHRGHFREIDTSVNHFDPFNPKKTIYKFLK